MLSLWKLRVGAEDYYLDQVARGLDDYYSGRGETVGRWTGSGAQALGLGGDVAGDDLRAVMAGLAPGTALTPNGDRVVASRRRVPGFDLTFSVPKSVSVAYAVADPLVRGEIIAGCEAALADTLAWFEREACHVRRGSNNRHTARGASAEFGTRRLQCDGFVAATFRHRTSRANDPHLHWHVLVANIARGPDMRWTALDATGLYRSKRTAGVFFQARMREQLSTRLGVGWRPGRKDSAEIVGIATCVLRRFSKRHDQIEGELARRGVEGPAAEDEALLETRTVKDELGDQTLDQRWLDEAATAGFGPVEFDEVLADGNVPLAGEHFEVVRVDHVSGEHRHVAVGFDEWVTDLAERLLDIRAAVTRHEFDGDHRRTIRHARRPRQRRATDRTGERVNTAATDPAAVRFHVDSDVVEQVIAESTLGDDQAAAVRNVAASTSMLDVVVGRAGTGKTYTIRTLNDLYDRIGVCLVGVATAGRAAQPLAQGAGIDTCTVASLLHGGVVGGRPLSGSDVLIIDETGMTNTRDLAAVLTVAADRGTKVILVGDHRQLPEVGAGGGFAHIVTHAGGAVSELTVNRRQTAVWEQDALAEVRHGDTAAGLGRLRRP